MDRCAAVLVTVVAIAHQVYLAPLAPEGSSETCILFADGQYCNDKCRMKGFNAGECTIYLCICNSKVVSSTQASQTPSGIIAESTQPENSSVQIIESTVSNQLLNIPTFPPSFQTQETQTPSSLLPKSSPQQVDELTTKNSFNFSVTSQIQQPTQFSTSESTSEPTSSVTSTGWNSSVVQSSAVTTSSAATERRDGRAVLERLTGQQGLQGLQMQVPLLQGPAPTRVLPDSNLAAPTASALPPAPQPNVKGWGPYIYCGFLQPTSRGEVIPVKCSLPSVPFASWPTRTITKGYLCYW